MTSRERDTFRKYESGNVKREKKRKAEELMQKHRGIMNKFVTISKNEDIEITENPKQSNSSYLDNTPNIILNDDIEITENTKQSSSSSLDNTPNIILNDDIEVTEDLKQSNSLHLDNTPNIFNIDENSTKNHILESNNKFIGKNVIGNDDCLKNQLHIWSDPGNWPSHIDSQIRYDIINLDRILKEKLIDQQHLSIIEKEKIHWKNVLNRILSVIHYLAAHNDAFRGSSDVLYTKSNGKFLGLIEILAKFDPVIMEHVNRIQNKETHVHYLGHRIQDEIINMMANEIKQKILRNIQSAKYFTIIMDCTPDIGHSEQLAILLRIVHMDEENEYSTPTIQEYFLDFITVDSTTGLNLSDVLMKQLKLYKINIENCRGQAYDNGSNMTGRYQGVQTRILNINTRAFFTPCAIHNLNLVLCDAAKNSTIAITFFGVVRSVYTLFSASTCRWSIIKKHCTVFTIKQ
ncbi:hypothetical protein QTP88_025403 [Uroleucon formosanum]